jgi:hypothetical protein
MQQIRMTKRVTYQAGRIASPRIKEEGSAYASEGGLVRTTIDLAQNHHRKLKVYAAHQGVKIADLVRSWIDLHCT